TEQSLALAFFYVQRIDGRSSRTAVRAQVGDQKHLLQIDQILVGADRDRLAIAGLQRGVLDGKNLIALADDQKIALSILVCRQYAAYHRRLEVDLQMHVVRETVVRHLSFIPIIER